MITVLIYIALASIVLALYFTALCMKHPIHIIGLGIIGTGLACGLIKNYDMGFLWMTVGTIIIGIGGAIADRVKKK